MANTNNTTTIVITDDLKAVLKELEDYKELYNKVLSELIKCEHDNKEKSKQDLELLNEGWKDKIRTKIDNYADKLISDINNTLNAEQTTEELKAFYKKQRVKYEAQLQASRDIEKLLEEL